jgi:hypothetical protein
MAVRIAFAPVVIALGATIACNAIVGYGELEKTPTKEDPEKSSSSGKGDDDDTTSSSSSSSGTVGSSSGTASSSGSSSGGVGPKCDPTKPFGPATALPPNINTGAFEDGGSLTADELTIVFMRGSDQTHAQLMIATRGSIDAAFSDPTPIAAGGTANNWPPWISSDGLTLYWSVLGTTMDIFMSQRGAATAAFTNKQSSPWMNGNYDEFRPSITADGNEMFFLSEKGSNVLQAFHSLKSGGAFQAPTAVTELNGDGQASSIAISNDGLTVYYGSSRTGSTNGTSDIWTARRDTRTSSFGTLTRVNELSSDGEELPSYISTDGCRLYFGTNRTGGGDIYVAAKPL